MPFQDDFQQSSHMGSQQMYARRHGIRRERHLARPGTDSRSAANFLSIRSPHQGLKIAQFSAREIAVGRSLHGPRWNFLGPQVHSSQSSLRPTHRGSSGGAWRNKWLPSIASSFPTSERRDNGLPSTAFNFLTSASSLGGSSVGTS
jgi:hypothetical protein